MVKPNAVLNVSPPTLAFVGWSGSGKTTLIESVLPLLRAAHLRVALIKHSHHHFDIDHPGKDTYRYRQAGASEILITSPSRWAIMHDHATRQEPTLADSLAKLSPTDLVLVEGFSREPGAKIEVFRASLGKPRLTRHNPEVIAVASDSHCADAVVTLDLNAASDVAEFIIAWRIKQLAQLQPSS